MMAVIVVPVPLTPAVTETLVTAGAAVHTISDTLKIPLTPQQTTELISVATNREAIIDAVQVKLMQGHPSTLPSGVTNVSFQALNQQGIDTDSLISIYEGVVNTLKDFKKVVNHNRMTIVTQTLDNGKLLAKRDTGIKTDVNAIVNTYYKRAAPKVATVNNLPVSGSLSLSGVIPGKMMINLGTSILSVINEVGEVAEEILINPSSSAKLPNSWKRICVTSLSTTNPGKFSIFMK